MNKIQNKVSVEKNCTFNSGKVRRSVKECDEDLNKSQKTILLVEDEDEVRNFIAYFLKQYNYNVFDVSNEKEAMELIEDKHIDIDLLVMDLILKDIRGEKLASKILEILPGTKLIYMSGYSYDYVMKFGLLEEGINFIAKPFILEDFVERIRIVLNED